jgi:hypothetical protein
MQVLPGEETQGKIIKKEREDTNAQTNRWVS